MVCTGNTEISLHILSPWWGWYSEVKYSKCQDLRKFQFSGGGGILKPNSSLGVNWAIWSKISGRLACLCITDSLSHTTYVETKSVSACICFKCVNFAFTMESSKGSISSWFGEVERNGSAKGLSSISLTLTLGLAPGSPIANILTWIGLWRSNDFRRILF